eukprot:3935545-Rhodomonas_salina.6
MRPEHEPAEGEENVPMIRVRHGPGVYKLDGNVYEGEWQDDKMQGHGGIILHSPNVLALALQ